MSSIVARSSPSFGSTSSAKDFRWISIRCGTSSGFLRREKLLRVAGAALVPANWATPQGIRRVVRPRKKQAAGLTGARTVHSNARRTFGQGSLTRPGWGRSPDLTPIPSGYASVARQSRLLDLGRAAGLLDLLGETFGLIALDALLDGLGSLVDEGLRLLEAEAGGRANDLDHADLLVAGSGQDDVDRSGLLLARSVSRRPARGGRCGRDGGRGDPELLLERLDALGELEH